MPKTTRRSRRTKPVVKYQPLSPAAKALVERLLTRISA